MWIAETIDLDNHDSVVKFLKNQSDKIEKLEEENEQLKSEINMLKIIIGRNEAYINRITSNGKFSNTSMK